MNATYTEKQHREKIFENVTNFKSKEVADAIELLISACESFGGKSMLDRLNITNFGLDCHKF